MEDPGSYPCAASAADMLEALLVWRRDVRHFLARPILESEMERLFALAQLAPSVGNAQPWRFCAFARHPFAERWPIMSMKLPGKRARSMALEIAPRCTRHSSCMGCAKHPKFWRFSPMRHRLPGMGWA